MRRNGPAEPEKPLRRQPPTLFAACAVLLSGAVALACQDKGPGEPPNPPPPSVASVAMSPETATVVMAQTLQLAATPKDSAGSVLDRTITWSSSDTSILTVSDGGLVTARYRGSATVTATSQTRSATATITVVHPPGAWASRVFIVVFENRDYGHVIGNSLAPYINGLASRYGVATAYYGNRHPSIGNYFVMTAGDTITGDDTFTGVVTADNVVRQLLAAGRTWRSYAEDLPATGSLVNNQYPYARYHNILSFYSDVRNDSVQRNNLVPLSQLAGDVAADRLPNYVMIVPNLCHDGHDCAIDSADAWVRRTIDPLIQSAAFQRDGVLILAWDESETSSTNGGGRIPFVIVGPLIRPGYSSSRTYQHESLLRMSLKALGVTSYPGGAATAPEMDEFFVP